MLNFVHNLSPRELKQLIKKYLKNIGPYTLLIDNIFKKKKFINIITIDILLIMMA